MCRVQYIWVAWIGTFMKNRPTLACSDWWVCVYNKTKSDVYFVNRPACEVPSRRHILFLQVTAHGPGIEKHGVTVNKWAEFTVDTRRAGRANLEVSCIDAEYNNVDVLVKDNRDGTYYCRYMPKKPIKHTVMISYGSVSIPGSPYRVGVT